MVSDTGVYAVGLMCEMRYLQSKPPIECARKLIERPEAFLVKTSLRLCAREVMEPVDGTLVTMTSAPSFSRTMESTFDQYCF